VVHIVTTVLSRVSKASRQLKRLTLTIPWEALRQTGVRINGILQHCTDCGRSRDPVCLSSVAEPLTDSALTVHIWNTQIARKIAHTGTQNCEA
jgi:hypothetical protein